MDAIFLPEHQLNLLLLRRLVTCSDCDSYDLRPFRYGLGAEGGCIIGSTSPKLCCNHCGLVFFTDSEISERFDGPMKPDFDEDYLINDILLNTESPTSDYTKIMALPFIWDEKNLAHLRLVLDDKFQSALTSQIGKVRDE